MQRDRSVLVLTDEFQSEYPERFLNVGISEAAMIGLAAGLALSGKQVFVYGIVPFVTLRCLEQIRVDLCYNNLPVRIIGIGGGVAYGPAGPTHHAVEDLAVMCALPNMTVICPGDSVEAGRAVTAAAALPGPAYLRLEKSSRPIHDARAAVFAIGRAIEVRAGRDVGLVATGSMLEVAVAAADLLASRGLAPAVVSMHTLKPLDGDLLRALARRCHTLASIEEHSAVGGLGSRVADWLAAERQPLKLLKFALPDAYIPEGGSQAHLRRRFGLSADAIAARLLKEAAPQP
jgi:transketolase